MDEYLVFKAIGDPVRIDILKFLSGGAKSVGEIVAEFDLSQPAISHHLGILKNAQLVKIKGLNWLKNSRLLYPPRQIKQ